MIRAHKPDGVIDMLDDFFPGNLGQFSRAGPFVAEMLARNQFACLIFAILLFGFQLARLIFRSQGLIRFRILLTQKGIVKRNVNHAAALGERQDHAIAQIARSIANCPAAGV